jgi:hypothetical protein
VTGGAAAAGSKVRKTKQNPNKIHEPSFSKEKNQGPESVGIFWVGLIAVGMYIGTQKE